MSNNVQKDEVRAATESWADAIRARDFDKLMEHYSDEVVVFDVPPPVSKRGKAVFRNSWEEFLGKFKGEITVKFKDMEISVGDNVAFIHTLTKIDDDNRSGSWVRVTLGLKKVDGRWLTTHEHASIPAEIGGITMGDPTQGTKQKEADLILRLYEMRREEEFRKAREWFDTEFYPRSAQDIIDLMQSGFAKTAYFRMVLTYWEMVAGLVNYGAIDPGLIHKTNVEHLRYYAKIEPFLAEVRESFGGEFLPELDKLVKTAPGFEKRLEGWKQLNKSWIAGNGADGSDNRET